MRRWRLQRDAYQPLRSPAPASFPRRSSTWVPVAARAGFVPTLSRGDGAAAVTGISTAHMDPEDAATDTAAPGTSQRSAYSGGHSSRLSSFSDDRTSTHDFGRLATTEAIASRSLTRRSSSFSTRSTSDFDSGAIAADRRTFSTSPEVIIELVSNVCSYTSRPLSSRKPKRA